MFVTSLRVRGDRLLRLAAGICLALLSACGGSGDMSSSNSSMPNTPGAATSGCSASSCGAVMTTMTDAKGDFLSYIVTLTSLQLQTANGTSVETLTSATQVDFAQLVDLTEVLGAGQIPAANYVSATLTLDYTNASITADDGTGHGVALQPVDASGNPLTATVAVAVQLDNAHHLVITPGNTSRLAFDFNLAASNVVDLTAATVQVAPILAATVVPSDTKQIRVRGGLASAAAAQNDFVLNIQPFHDTSATVGQVTVQVTATTTYQVNGTAYVGAAGLTALAALPVDTMIAAFGTLQGSSSSQTFTAANVLAGTSLENPVKDEISGTVVARSQATLTLRGATWIHRGGSFGFELKDVTVMIGTNTAVTEEAQMGAFTIADISVGQSVDAFGTATTDSTGATTLDATAGQARLNFTAAWGLITSMATGSLTVNLQSLGGMPPSALTFTGTGNSSANDASPAAYVINTGMLDQTGLTLNAPARVIGFVTPFGMAPPDFAATTLVNFSKVTEDLAIGWGRMGSATAFTGLSSASTSLEPNLTNAGNLHGIQIGPQLLDLTSLAMPPTLVPDATATDELFTIGHEGRFRTENFNTFAAFVAALSGDLTGSTAVVAVVATGQYDSAADTFTATRIAVLLSN